MLICRGAEKIKKSGLNRKEKRRVRRLDPRKKIRAD